MGGDGMSDLVERLRAHNAYKYTGISAHAAADRIEMLEREVAASYANQASLINRVEQLERELAKAREWGIEQATYHTMYLNEAASFRSQLAAEKALADDLYDQVVAWVGLRPEDADSDDDVVMNLYRKARGL